MRILALIFFLLNITVIAAAQRSYVDSLRSLLGEEISIDKRIDMLNELSREQLRISPDQAYQTINTLKALADSAHSEVGLAHYYRLMAGLSAIQGNHLYATSFVFQAIHLYEKLNDSTGIANSYIAVANNYSRQRLYPQAVQYQKKALKIFEKQKSNRRISVCLTNLAFLYNNLGKYDSALFTAQRSMLINEKEKYQSVLINDYKNIGYTFLYKGEFEKSKQNFSKALSLHEHSGREINTEAVTETLIGLGRLNYSTGNKREAYQYLHKAIHLADSNNFFTWKRDGLLLLSQYNFKDGNTRDAYLYLLQHTAVVDSLAQKQRVERAKLGDIYLNSLRESYQNDLLKKERELKDEVLKQQRIGILLGASAIVLLLLLVYYLKRSNIKRRKINYMLNEQKEEIADKRIQLEKLIRTKDKFFSIVAHDLRSPLNSLKSFTSLINQHADKLSKEEIVTTARQLDSTIDNTIKMAESLLTWAKQQMQADERNPEIINVRLLTGEIVELYREAADHKNIRLDIEVPADVVVYSDKNHFMFLIRNLINNAIKFTPSGGKVTIGAIATDGQTQISVRDTGVGMSKDTLENLFEIHTSRKSYGTAGEKGTGLGLILCKEFVNVNHGKIWAESEPGNGSVFYISLPQDQITPF